MDFEGVISPLLYSRSHRIQHLSLHGGLLGPGLLDLGHPGGGLGAEAAPAPVAADLLGPLVVVGLDGLHQLGQGAAVVGLNLDKNIGFTLLKGSLHLVCCGSLKIMGHQEIGV